MRSIILGELPPVSLLSWSMGGLVFYKAPLYTSLYSCKAVLKNQLPASALKGLSINVTYKCNHKCTVMGETYGNILTLSVSILQGVSLYKVHQIKRATISEPTV